jgi:hypothetical protein
VLYGGDNLIDGDLAIDVTVARDAVIYLQRFQGDVYHQKDLIDGHPTVLVAIADTRRFVDARATFDTAHHRRHPDKSRHHQCCYDPQFRTYAAVQTRQRADHQSHPPTMPWTGTVMP